MAEVNIQEPAETQAARFYVALDIQKPGDKTAHCASVRLALERVAMASFGAPRFEAARWPQSVRNQLWP
jgi:hypothetical protein